MALFSGIRRREVFEGRPCAAERGPRDEAPHPACAGCVSVAADDDERVWVPGRILKDEVGSVYFLLVYCAPGYLWGRKKLSAERCTTSYAVTVGGLRPRSRGSVRGNASYQIILLLCIRIAQFIGLPCMIIVLCALGPMRDGLV